MSSAEPTNEQRAKACEAVHSGLDHEIYHATWHGDETCKRVAAAIAEAYNQALVDSLNKQEIGKMMQDVAAKARAEAFEEAAGIIEARWAECRRTLQVANPPAWIAEIRIRAARGRHE